MKLIYVFLIILLFLSTLHGQTFTFPDMDPYNPSYEPKVVLVKFKDEAPVPVGLGKTTSITGIQTIDQLHSRIDIESVERVFRNATPQLSKRSFKDHTGKSHDVSSLDKVFRIKYKATLDPLDVARMFEEDPNIEYAEPDYHVYAMATYPDDPLYQSGDQWYVDSVNAPAAWDSTTGDTTQIIGIIDTGVDWDHPDLDDNIWVNYPELNGIEGVDDDGNGYVDDIRGWDFVNDDNDPDDDNSHGTHVAGIAAAETDNGIGIAGIAWNSKIMPIKMLQSSGIGSSSDLAAGIEYAASNGATVINMSLGSYGESITVKIALENAYSTSVLVAAAGNNGYKIDRPYPPWPPYAPLYPGCYSFIIGVEATTPSGFNALFSNFDPTGPILTNDGFYWNDFGYNYEIKAPGVDILSTSPNGNYKRLSGTSMATPIVSGAVALLKSFNPTQSTEQLFAKLIQGSNNGILDVRNSLDYELVPDLYFVEYTIIDTLPGSDGDGVADAGETIELYLTVKNAGGFADSVWSKFRFGEYEDISTAEIIDSTSYIGDISAYASLTGNSDLLKIKIDSDVVNNRNIVFEYEIGCTNCTSIKGELIIVAQKGIEIFGSYSKLQLYKDSFYIVTEPAVIDTLIINPGVTVRFSDQMFFMIIDSISAIGTPDSMITFKGADDARVKGIIISEGGKSIFEYCIFEDGWGEYTDPGYLVNPQKVHNSIFRYNHYKMAFTLNQGMDIQKNMFIANWFNGFGEHNYIMAWGNPSHFRYNIVSNNLDINPTGSTIKFYANSDLSNYTNNVFIGNEKFSVGTSSWNGWPVGIYSIPQQYWGSIDEDFVKSQILDFYEFSDRAVLEPDSILALPPSESHGIVWKVGINDILVNKYDNPYNSQSGLGVVGSESLKFDVYFNRAMDTTYTPLLTFGVREPYTQHVVYENASWNTDSTIWTAYNSIGLETGDGIQNIRVAKAKDDERFEIPIEDSRFQFVIQAAGAASIAFIATPGIGKVDLEWPTAESDDVLGYNIYRFESVSDSTFSDTVIINNSLVTDTMFIDFDVMPDSTYRYLYSVVGTDMAESDYSKSVSATPFSAPNGDANGDLSVDILDIISMVSYLLQDNPQPFLFDAADINGDDVINVLDIIGVVSIILGGGTEKIAGYDATDAVFILDGDNLFSSSNGMIGGYQFVVAGDIEGLRVSSKYPMELSTVKISEDTLFVLVYSLSGKVIPGGNEEILSFSKSSGITLTDLIVSDRFGKAVNARFGDHEDLVVPREFALSQNYPNPFNSITTINYELPEVSDIRLVIYNILGQVVTTHDRMNVRPGYHSYAWNGKNKQGVTVSSGVYIYRLKAGIHTATKKMILLK